MTHADRYILHRFPIVIDPLAVALEVKVVRGRSAPSAAQLHRVLPDHETFPFSLTNRMVHFFGPEPRAVDCPFLLVYDAVGMLRYRVDKEDGEFVAKEMPDEIVGGRVARPSVRLTFVARSDADLFGDLVAAARRGDPLTPEAGAALNGVLRRCEEVRHTAVTALL